MTTVQKRKCRALQRILMCATVCGAVGAPAQTPPQVAGPSAQHSDAAADERRYSGERLSLSFQNIETRAVLQLLAETSGVNIVVSDSVQSSVTLQLRDVPWDQVLDIVLTTKGLDMRRNGNAILVAPAEELAARERSAVDERFAAESLQPLQTAFIQVNYAKAADLANLISGSGHNPMISTRGSGAIDERTNTVLVQDAVDRIDAIRELVEVLDMPVRQVLIESRIVVVNHSYRRHLGVRLGATAV